MLNINKVEPTFFIEYKRKEKPQKYSDCIDIFNELKESLIKEQKRQCAYCEILINLENSHIEHIKPRNPKGNREKEYYKLECDYNNLVASCSNQYRCGEFKKNKKYEDNFIHPVFDNAEKFFEYQSNGKIYPKKNLSENDKIRAKNTRDYLNLNESNLVEIRRGIIESLKYCQGYDLNKLIEEFAQFETLIKNTCYNTN